MVIYLFKVSKITLMTLMFSGVKNELNNSRSMDEELKKIGTKIEIFNRVDASGLVGHLPSVFLQSPLHCLKKYL